MQAVGSRQSEKTTEAFKLRHLSGLSFPGTSIIPAKIPMRLTKGSLRDIDPWWHADPVRRYYNDEELTPDRRVGQTDKYLVRTETRDIVLLDGRKIKIIRKVYFDRKTRLHSKEFLAKDEDGKIFAFNTIPRNLLALDGLEFVSIPDKDIFITEGHPAAEALRKRGVQAVAIIGGTFHVPPERALEPLLKAKNILLWPDNDSAGASLMSRVANALHIMGAREGQIKFVFWRGGPRKGDAYDFTGNDEELKKLVDESVVWSPELCFATSSIKNLSVPKIPSKLRLDSRIQPPTPELVREKASFGGNSVLEEIFRNLFDAKPLSEEQRNLLEALISRYSAK